MKRLLISLLALTVLTACQPDLHFLRDTLPFPDAEISENGGTVSLVFSSDAGSTTLSFQSNKRWTAFFLNDRAREWCSIPSESGERGTYKLCVSVTENQTYDERSATIILQCEDVRRVVVVTQKQLDALLLSPGRVEIAQEGGDFTIEVKTNVDFTLSVPSEVSTWLHRVGTKGLESYSYTFQADANTDLQPRQAVLKVDSSLGNEVVTVYQPGEDPALVISAREVEVPTMGGSFEVQITSNLDVETEYLPASCDWVEEVKTKMFSTNTYYFLVEPNGTGEAREMSLVFRNAEYKLSDTLHVRQASLPGFSFTTTQHEVKGTWLKEPGEGVRVFWGDGSYDLYTPDLTHNYTQPGSHTVIVEGDPLAPICISELEDGMVMDFSRLWKKEDAQ